MPIAIAWTDIVLRLGLCLLASAAIGINRGEQDRPVGLRTTMLVSLAAAISMLQVNLLLPVGGKAGDLFVVMDLMRLPLGILSGMGFIGAGAIVRRDDLVQGVTTAATLWFATVMGLCFGGGQLYLGVTALALAILILWPLKWLEKRVGHLRRGKLSIITNDGDGAEALVLERCAASGFRVGEASITLDAATGNTTICYQVSWYPRKHTVSPFDLARDLSRRSDITGLEWKPLGQP